MSDHRPLLIRGATLLTMDPDVGDFDRGDVLVDGDRVTAVAAHLDPEGPTEVLDATGCIVIPGLVDTHRHMWQALLRGCAPDHTLADYFTHVLGVIGPTLTPRDVHLGTLLSARAALDAGVTTVQDIANIQDSPEHTDASVEALRESGLRAVFAYGKSFPAMLSEGSGLPDDVRRVRSDLLPHQDSLVTMALTAEAGDDGAELRNAALARELGLRTARHVSADYPVSRLADLGTLLCGTTFIHGNGLAPHELRLIADHGGSLSISPAIERTMGHGHPMFGPAATAGVPVSLSTDVEVTTAADLFTQMRAAHQIGRATGLTVRDVLAQATISGARVLGLAGRTGSLTPGKQADLVVLRADCIGVAPVHDPYSTVVLQVDRAHVDTVLVAGKVVKRAGRLLADSTALLDEARAASCGPAAAGVPAPHPPVRA
ncbi:MAG: amidohydrolase family protein [Umezawaea sp.]